MKKEITYCDACGAVTELESIKVTLGREHNGIEYVSNVKQVDLCGRCAVSSLYIFLPDDKAKEFVDYIKAVRCAPKVGGK